MTDLRSSEELQAHFAGPAKTLDDALESARPTLLAWGITIRDHSNRSGFDWSGYGTPSWRFAFEARGESASPVTSVTVTIAYEEPLERGKVAELRTKVVAEVFYLGVSTSMFRWARDLPMTLDDVSGERMLAAITNAIDEALTHVPAEYRFSLRDNAGQSR